MDLPFTLSFKNLLTRINPQKTTYFFLRNVTPPLPMHRTLSNLIKPNRGKNPRVLYSQTTHIYLRNAQT